MVKPSELMASQLKSSKPYLGELCRTLKKDFELRDEGQSTEDTETWLRNNIVLIPKKQVIDRLGSQTRGIGVQSVLAKWYCGCLTILMEMEKRNVGGRDKVWENLDTFGFEEGRSAAAIPSAIKSMTAAAQEWGADLVSLLAQWM